MAYFSGVVNHRAGRQVLVKCNDVQHSDFTAGNSLFDLPAAFMVHQVALRTTTDFKTTGDVAYGPGVDSYVKVGLVGSSGVYINDSSKVLSMVLSGTPEPTLQEGPVSSALGTYLNDGGGNFSPVRTGIAAGATAVVAKGGAGNAFIAGVCDIYFWVTYYTD